MTIQVKNLSFEYPDKRALDNVTFEIDEGAITAMVGPNGAGKTTLLRCLAALAKPFAGEIYINGVNAITHPREVHQSLGYLSDNFGLYEQLTARQSLLFTANSRLNDHSDINNSMELAINRSGIQSFIDKKISSLSRGMRQRVGIAQAIIHKPKILLLDEPASGLDPEARYSLSQLLIELRNAGMLIIVSSHILAELEDYSSEMLVIQDGKMIEHRKLGGRRTDKKSIIISFEKFEADYKEIISKIEGVSEVAEQDNKILLLLDEAVLTKGNLLKKIIQLNLPVEEISEPKINMQDEYIKTLSNYKENKA